MCGICGVVQVGGGAPRPVIEAERLLWMTDVMTHRGPNDRGTYVAEGVAFGVRRLSIVDVEGGHQPFANETKTVWGMQNGELYNHLELRKVLSDHRFASACDTEVLPHLYERFGPMFPTKLRGKFSVAVWDEANKRAVVARDRLGVKPLYYAQQDDVLVFASELKSLLASGLVEPELDLEAIDAYLTFGFVPGPRTALRGVSKLMPGHLLVADERGVQIEQYWEYPAPSVSAERLSVDGYAERLLNELEESVKLRLMSDVPLGAMLSGGLDSSLIVALMARNMGEPVKTFSVGFTEAREANELDDARLVAREFGTDHHELELSFAHDTVSLEDLVWHLDEPLASLSALGFLALSQLAAQHVTVALSGQGADELLAGYQKYRAASLVGKWRALPGPVRVIGNSVASRGPARIRRLARVLESHDTADRLVAMSSRITPRDRERLVRGELEAHDGLAAQRAVIARLNGISDDPVPATLFVDAQLSLVDDMLHYFDRTSMAYSLEVRVPFLDHHLVEFCAQIPADLKVRRLKTKYLLRRAARGLVPDQIIDKPKIGFFHAAVDSWFKTQARGATEKYLLDSNPAYADFLDPAEVARIVRRHADAPEERDGQLLLALLMLEIWLSTFLPRALGRPQPERLAV